MAQKFNQQCARALTMKGLSLILAALLFLMSACARPNNTPPPIIYPDPEEYPHDYNPGY